MMIDKPMEQAVAVEPAYIEVDLPRRYSMPCMRPHSHSASHDVGSS
jgi:hypothetical protein